MLPVTDTSTTVGALAGAPGAAASPARAAAFRRFEAAGLPTRRVESWHYTDLRVALAKAAPLAAPPQPPPAPSPPRPVAPPVAASAPPRPPAKAMIAPTIAPDDPGPLADDKTPDGFRRFVGD